MVKGEGDNWWLGLHTFDNDGRFRWSDHSVLNYVSWAANRPRPLSRDRRCVHLIASKGETNRAVEGMCWCVRRSPEGWDSNNT